MPSYSGEACSSTSILVTIKGLEQWHGGDRKGSFAWRGHEGKIQG